MRFFLGSPVKRASGQQGRLAGPTGREPLVGLQISIAESRSPSAEVRRAGEVSSRRKRRVDHMDEPIRPHQKSEGSGTNAGGRKRVFRSRPPTANADIGEPNGRNESRNSALAESKSKVRVFSREQLKANR